MSDAPADPTITMFVESRAWRTTAGEVRSTDPEIAGMAWQDELREHRRLRLALRVQDGVASEEGRAVGGRVVGLPSYVGLAAALRRLPALFAAIDDAVRSTDVVCAKLPGIVGLIAVERARARRKPIAVQVVGDVGVALRSGVGGRVGGALAPIAVALTRRAVRRGEVVRYVTERVLQERYPPRAGAIAFSYSDVRADFGEAGSVRCAVPGRVIAVGSQEQLYKGHQVLIEAIALLVADHASIHLVIVGSGRYQPQLRELAGARGVADRVRFAGHIGDRVDLLQVDRAQVFAMPSLTEGLPRALIEAMARGLPCVGSDVGGIPELLQSDALAPPGDAPALAAVLGRALGDPGFRERITAEGLDRAQRYRAEALESRRRKWSESFDLLLRQGKGAA